MVIGGLRQLVAATQSASFEHSAAVSCGHALAESVYAHAAADLRLVRTFGHASYLVSK